MGVTSICTVIDAKSNSRYQGQRGGDSDESSNSWGENSSYMIGEDSEWHKVVPQMYDHIKEESNLFILSHIDQLLKQYVLLEKIA